MASVFGNVLPGDDYTHPLGPEMNFNDSMCFNFFDTKKNTGGFLRVGTQANKRYAVGREGVTTMRSVVVGAIRGAGRRDGGLA